MGYGFVICKKTVNGENFYEQYKENEQIYTTNSLDELRSKLDEITMNHPMKYVRAIQNIESSYDTNVTDSLGGGSGSAPVLSDAEIDEIFKEAHKLVYGN